MPGAELLPASGSPPQRSHGHIYVMFDLAVMLCAVDSLPDNVERVDRLIGPNHRFPCLGIDGFDQVRMGVLEKLGEVCFSFEYPLLHPLLDLATNVRQFVYESRSERRFPLPLLIVVKSDGSEQAQSCSHDDSGERPNGIIGQGASAFASFTNLRLLEEAGRLALALP